MSLVNMQDSDALITAPAAVIDTITDMPPVTTMPATPTEPTDAVADVQMAAEVSKIEQQHVEPADTTTGSAQLSKKRKLADTDTDDIPEFTDTYTVTARGRPLLVTAQQQRTAYMKQRRLDITAANKKLKQQQQQQSTTEPQWGTSFNCHKCEGTGDLIGCVGGCKLLWHLQCAPSAVPEGDDAHYTCHDCTAHDHECFACHQHGADSIDVYKCNRDDCGRYFHLTCVSDYKLAKFASKTLPDGTEQRTFTCPQHYCDACGDAGTKNQPVIKCIRCPTAYHYDYKLAKQRDTNLCLPQDINTNDVLQGGWCLCRKIDFDHTHLATTDLSGEDLQRAAELSKPVPLVSAEGCVNFVDCTFTPPAWEYDFQIPLSLIIDVENMRKKPASIKASAFGKPTKMAPPPHYRKIGQNDWRFVGGKPTMRSDEIEVCSCVFDPEQGKVCDDDCELRAMHIECTRWCKSGEQCQNQRLRNKQYANFKLTHTADRGYGLVANDIIQPGQLIIEYCGEVIDEEECHRRLGDTHAAGNKNFYMMKLSRNYVIDAQPAGSMARFINHSCSPNCHTEQWTVNGSTRVGIYASRKIEIGTELTYDYLCDTFGEIAEEPCRCGAENCSGVLGGKKLDAGGKAGKNKQKKKSLKAKAKLSKDAAVSDDEDDDDQKKRARKPKNIVAAKAQAVGESDEPALPADMMTVADLERLTPVKATKPAAVNNISEGSAATSAINDSDMENVPIIVNTMSVQPNGYVKQQVELIEQRTEQNA